MANDKESFVNRISVGVRSDYFQIKFIASSYSFNANEFFRRNKNNTIKKHLPFNVINDINVDTRPVKNIVEFLLADLGTKRMITKGR